jgi:hypothetical protein
MRDPAIRRKVVEGLAEIIFYPEQTLGAGRFY